MPAREPTYYRWAEDKPCTTNQTYGYELRSADSQNGGCFRCNTCKMCAAEAAAATAKAEVRQQQREMAAGNQDDGGVGVVSYSGKARCKPINKGYTMGHVPITRRLQASNGGSGAGRHRNVAGTSSGELDPQANGEDLYLWHALSGTLVYLKNDEQCDQ